MTFLDITSALEFFHYVIIERQIINVALLFQIQPKFLGSF